DQMKQAVDKAIAVFGAIHGVIHAAGIIGDRELRVIPETDTEVASWHFIPKVYGWYELERLLPVIRPDFCLMLSSLASVLGGLGATAYSAANLFLDHCIQLRARGTGIEWLTVNWDGAASDEETAEGLARILNSCHLTQIVSSTIDLEFMMDKWITRADASPAASSDNRPAQGRHQRPNLKNAYIEPSSELESTIAGFWSELLGISPIGIYDHFFDLGGDSLLGTQLIARLRSAFEIELSLHLLFHAPSVSEQAVFIEEQVLAEIEALDEEEVGKVLQT
ncbi:KR domain-containing protein, partial [Paenibacillus sp. GbtcB18]|uniref:KR domain-containing protein n=1 Tax=Paenibacillus sp. GbtcB18 TaxID=2824763 RepID=UPI001C30F62D